MTDATPDRDLAAAATDRVATARILRRVLGQWPLVLLCVVVAGAAAFVLSDRRTKIYEATSIMQVGSVDLVTVFLSQDISVGDVDPARQTAGAVETFNLPNVRDRAARELGGRVSSDGILAALSVQSSPDNNVLRVNARSADPQLARDISIAMSDSFVRQRVLTTRRTLTNAKKTVRRQIANLSEEDRNSPTGLELQDRLRQVGVIGALTNGNVEIIQKARVPTAAVSPQPRRDALLAALAGLVIGLGIALLRARIDDRVRDTAELAEIWDLPVVGVVPQTGGLGRGGTTMPDGPALEALSLARTNLRYLHVGGTVKTVVVTSALAGEGKSTITLNLAVAASLAGSRVLVVEGDLRRPGISKRLGVATGNGLSEVLAGIASIDDAVRPVSISGEGEAKAATVDLLPAGLVPPSPIALLEGPETKALLATLRERYDIVLIDTPPAVVVADAIAIVDEVDGVLVVSRLGTVRRGPLARLRDTLESVDAPVLGQLVNSGADAKSYAYYTQSEGRRLPWRRASSSTGGS